MNEARQTNGKFRHPTPSERPSRGDVGDEYGYGEVYDLDTPTLSDGEQTELQQHESVIQRGLQTFLEVGIALMAIRDRRLYRQTHATFEMYCQSRWNLTRRYVNNLIAASNVVENLGTIVPILPANEAQARPLTVLPPEQQREAWQTAVETAPNGRVTAAHVQATVDQIKTPPARVTYGQNEDDYQPDVPEVQVEETPAEDTWEEAQNKPPANGRYSENETEWKLGGRGATVRLKNSGMLGTLVFATGRMVYVETINGRRQYYADNVLRVEDQPAVEEPPTPSDPINYDAYNGGLADAALNALAENEQNGNYKRDSRTTRPATPGESQPYDRMQTPPYALDPLLPYLGWSLPTRIWEPACGEGLIVEALYDAGWKEPHVIGTDILTGQNFFEYAPDHYEVIVTNPPYSLKIEWIERCYALGKPFALLLPIEALGLTTVYPLLQEHGFEIMLLDSRVDFKMPNKGWDSQAQFGTFWLCHDLLPEKVMFGSIKTAKKAFKAEIGDTTDDDPE